MTTFSVTVVGQQFRWKFSYSEYELSNQQELVVPIGHTLELAVTSDDVLHGFRIQGLGVAVDAVPEERTTARVDLEEAGEYTAVCTEFCGEGHAEMTAPVRVVSQAEFKRWRAE